MGSNLTYQSIKLGIRLPDVMEPPIIPFAFAFEYAKMTIGARIANANQGLKLTGYPAAAVEQIFDELFDHIGQNKGERLPLQQSVLEVVSPMDVIVAFDPESGVLEDDLIALPLFATMNEMRGEFLRAVHALRNQEFGASMQIVRRTVDGKIKRYDNVHAFLRELAG